MKNLINELGGPSAVARMLNIKAPSVLGWGGRVPAERCPGIELAMAGKVTVEEIRPDVAWRRFSDPEWPHPAGRPCIDVMARAVTQPVTESV